MGEGPRRSAERARELHVRSIVVDTLSGGPSLFTDRMTERAKRVLEEGKSGIEAVVAAEQEMVRELAEDAGCREHYRRMWDEGGVTCASLTLGGLGSPPFSFRSGLESLARTTRVLDACDDWLAKVTRAEQVRLAHDAGKHGLILNFQNTTHFGLDLDRLDLFYDFGVRIIQLTYNQRNFVGDGCTERTDAGLSHFGVELVRRLNRMGVLVDLSHSGSATAWDAIRVSEKPVAFTHTFCRALSEHDRGKPDELLRAVAETGGYIGMVTVPFFISSEPQPTLKDVVRHVRHAVEVAGIDHVGIGTDWGAVYPRELADALNREMGLIGFRAEHRVDWNATMPDYRSWQDWPGITASLLEDGFTKEEVQKLLGLNFLRVFEQTVG
ncbi:MAG TPA: membrane dipeptidase [Bacillota bacterium]|nr:membrane dipeptidase [Bacillota bacterium]